MSEARRSAPIGVFDSGIGGLTVLRQLRRQLPFENVLYLADQAHVPYGGRPLDEVRAFACAIVDAMVRQGCKAIVMACNISTATALESARENHPGVPVLGVIGPGAQAAAHESRVGRVGVLSTEGTARSRAYTRAIHRLAPDTQVFEVACPGFVPLVEAGETGSAEAGAAIELAIAPLRAARVDTVVLGCTHYPFLLPLLQAAAPEMCFVDPSEIAAVRMADTLRHEELLRAHVSPPSACFSTTGDPAHFRLQLDLLPDLPTISSVLRASWHGAALELAMARDGKCPDVRELDERYQSAPAQV